MRGGATKVSSLEKMKQMMICTVIGHSGSGFCCTELICTVCKENVRPELDDILYTFVEN